MSKNLILLLTFFFVFAFITGLIGYYLSLNTKTGQPASSPEALLKTTSSCVILDEELCGKGERVDYNGQFYGLGFKLPKGTRIYSPFEGSFSSTPKFQIGDKTYGGIDLFYQPTGVLDENTLAFVAILSPESVTKKITVEAGEFVAEVGEEKVETLGDYNVIIKLQRFNPQTKYMETNEELLEKFFNL